MKMKKLIILISCVTMMSIPIPAGAEEKDVIYSEAGQELTEFTEEPGEQEQDIEDVNMSYELLMPLRSTTNRAS